MTPRHAPALHPPRPADDLGAATEDESSVGISWSNRAAYCQNKADDRAAQGFVAGVYRDFDCVFPISSGERRPPAWAGCA